MKQENYDWDRVGAVIEKYSPGLYKIAYSYTCSKEDCEDILQEVFIKYAGHGMFRDEEHEKAWLIRVTINHSINLVKSAHKRKIVPMEENVFSLKDDSDTGGEIKSIVMELPIKYRAAIYLYYYEEYKVEEIAKILNKKPSGVYTLLNRGRELLKKIIEEGGGRNG